MQQVVTAIEAPEAFRVEPLVSKRPERDAWDLASARTLGFTHFWQRVLDSGCFRSLTKIAVAESEPEWGSQTDACLCAGAPAGDCVRATSVW